MAVQELALSWRSNAALLREYGAGSAEPAAAAWEAAARELEAAIAGPGETSPGRPHVGANGCMSTAPAAAAAQPLPAAVGKNGSSAAPQLRSYEIIPSRLYAASEAAQVLGIRNPKTLYTMGRNGAIPVHRLGPKGGITKFSGSDLIKYLESRRT
jgi:hypothetical protein